MSLEYAVNRLAQAIEKHTDILSGQLGKGPPAAQPEAAAATPRPRGRPTLSTTPKADPTLDVTGSGATAPPQKSAAPAVSGIKYDVLREAVLKLAEVQGHKVGLEVLKPFGVTSAKALREDQYDAAYAAVTKQLGNSASMLA